MILIYIDLSKMVGIQSRERLRDERWFIDLIRDEQERSDLELSANVDGFQVVIGSRERCSRTSAYVDTLITTPNGIILNIKRVHFYEDRSATAIWDAVTYANEVKGKIERDIKRYILETLLH